MRHARLAPRGRCRHPRALAPAAATIAPATITATADPTTVADPAVTAVIEWWDAHGRALPWRPSRDTYAIWVSEVMSAQTSVTRAAAAWERWMVRWPTVQALAAASLAEVLAEWQGLGYPRRARDLHRSARIVSATGWPRDLTALPGVGAYVASAIRCFAREEPVLPLDVNTRRVLARRFPEGVDTSDDPWRAGQALMEFGQRICAARPDCEACPVSEGCAARSALTAGPRAKTGSPTAKPNRPRDQSGSSPSNAEDSPPAHRAATTDPAPRRRPQARYEGSLRQRRGTLLRRVLAAGEVALADADREAAEGLVTDGLLALRGGCLRVPE